MDRTVQLHELPPGALTVPYGTGAHVPDASTGSVGESKALSTPTPSYCHSTEANMGMDRAPMEQSRGKEGSMQE